MMNTLANWKMIEQTDGIFAGVDNFERLQADKLYYEMTIRNIEDLLDWLHEQQKITLVEKTGLVNLITAKDKEAWVLAIEIIKIKKHGT